MFSRNKSRLENEKKQMSVPLTGQENVMEEGTSLVTKTDLKGRITYANRNFSKISEIAVSELVGKAHNVIRHPDMPRSAFQDMWSTIQKGKPWRGMVKNRASSGNHYWVDANVAPRVENGEVVGYISVRRKPTREMIARAQEIYSSVLSGKMVFPYTDIPRLSVRTKMLLTVLFPALALPAGCGLSMLGVSWTIMFPVALAVGTISALSGLKMISFVLTPVQEATAMGNRIASGDLRVAIDHDRNDEIGELQKSLLNMLINTAGIISEATETSQMVNESSSGLREASENLSTGAEETSVQSQTIAAAADEMNRTLQLLSSAVEEMSISIAEVARKASDAAHLAQASSESAARADSVVRVLGESAAEIGKVVESIGSIAAQTNLLALNASIEAAGAGDAGKGFAVVAGEVKELARQSSESSVAVRERVATIQKSVTDTVSAMKQIMDTFSQVKDISASIAAAVEQQSIASKEIAGNVSQASKAADDVTKNISGISVTAREGAKSAKSVSDMARQMDLVAEKLRNVVAQFRV